MNLLNKIEWFYKLAQEANSPHQILKGILQNIAKQISQRSNVDSEHKSKLLKIFHDAIKDGESNSVVDANWSARVASLMDQVNYSNKNKDGEEEKMCHDLFYALDAAWDHIEKAGHKAHVQKPIASSQLH